MADKDQVIQALRATLISVKGALTIKQCNRDYRELQGEWIPFKKLGYPSLEKLFQDVPGFKLIQNNGEWYVDAIASQETQHIAAMVSRQKSSKKTLSGPNRFPKKQSSWRKPASSYSSNNNSYYSNQNYRPQSRPTQYTNNNNYKAVKYNYRSNEAKSYTAPAPVQHPKPLLAKPVYQSAGSTSAEGPTYRNETPPMQASKQLKQTASTSSESNGKASGPSTKVSASQRLSDLRDRLSTVDLIPLQLPAASNEPVLITKYESSGPVTQVTPAYSLEPPQDLSTSVAKLEWTCKKLGLQQPVYKGHEHRPKKGPVTYDCSVKVGTKFSAQSYPNSSPSSALAQEVAATKLLAAIESSEAAGLPTSAAPAALDALADLVARHEAGIWADTVPTHYRARYGENLPNNWQELVENCPRIKTDRLFNGLVYLPNLEVGVDVIQNKYYQDSSPYISPALAAEESIDSDLPILQFPADVYWNVHVNVANSTIEIWVQIIGEHYSDDLAVLMTDMDKYYSNSGTTVDRSMLIKNAWYACAVYVEEEKKECWHRAKLLEIRSEGGSFFFGDHGDDLVVPFQKIKILEPQYRKLAAQALLCRLEGAEELAAHALGAQLVAQRLPGEVLVAEPAPGADPYDPPVPMLLYDTSTPRDLNLNKEIVADFCMASAFALTQKLMEVEVGCVTEEGRVWVSRAGGAALVRNALAMVTAGSYRRPLPPASPAPLAPHALYIVRTLDGDWVRCTIISGLDGEGTVRTQLIDSGMILRAPLSSLVPLQSFSMALNDLPHQAMQVSLEGAERAASKLVPRLRELLLGACVLCRAAPASASASASAPAAAPRVELFVRTGPQRLLASVNQSIKIEYETLNEGKEKKEEQAVDAVEALNKKKERIFRSLSSAAPGEERAPPALPPPALPAPSQCFDVTVAMAANPWNFVVQPVTTLNTLNSMMSSLQRECPKMTADDAPLKPANGELYTVLYQKDSTWYRVIVSGCVSSETVSVYFCDYGDLALFANSDLRPVPAAAPLALTLPPQALKARLHDVWPLHKDWAVEDCVRFQELCVDQLFVAICKDVGKDPLNPNEPLLTIELIDTSTDDDHYINKQLVKEGRARLASST